MKLSQLSKTSTWLAALALVVCGQQVTAQETSHRLIRLAPPAKAAAAAFSPLHHPRTTPELNIYGLQATFTGITPTMGLNADGTDLWPCFGYGSAGTNLDCPTVGNPAVPFPDGGVVVGYPQYVWMLNNNSGYGYGNADGNGLGCDAFVNGTTGPTGASYKPCGQLATWYEDDTGDTTDDLLQRVVVRQGERVIYDSGVVDYGPAGPTVTYPVSVILNTDANFGYWPGSTVGPNNGNCSGNVNYPLASPAFPSKIYVVASGQTCHEPVAGKATVTTTTILATPYYKKMSGSACTGGASTCYTVEWNTNYQIHQDFDLFLE